MFTILLSYAYAYLFLLQNGVSIQKIQMSYFSLHKFKTNLFKQKALLLFNF